MQRQCATGMMAVQEAAAHIRWGMADVVDRRRRGDHDPRPMLFATKSARPFGGVERRMPPSHPSTPDAPNTNKNMLITVGENTAGECGIAEDVRQLVVTTRTCVPWRRTEDGRFAQEIVPVTVPAGAAGTVTVSIDEHPRADTTLEKPAALPVLSGPDGQVTAGNSSGIADGGAPPRRDVRARYADAHGMTRAGDGVSWNSLGIEPGANRGWRRRSAVPRGRTKAGLADVRRRPGRDQRGVRHQDWLVCAKLGFSHDIVNVNGGAVGMGHPICGVVGPSIFGDVDPRGSCAGAAAASGVGTLCAGGGMGCGHRGGECTRPPEWSPRLGSVVPELDQVLVGIEQVQRSAHAAGAELVARAAHVPDVVERVAVGDGGGLDAGEGGLELGG